MNAPIAEMGHFIGGSIREARAEQRFDEVLGWETAQDIHGEIVEAQAGAVSELDRAQCPKSPGGVAILPCEAKRIRARITGAV